MRLRNKYDIFSHYDFDTMHVWWIDRQTKASIALYVVDSKKKTAWNTQLTMNMRTVTRNAYTNILKTKQPMTYMSRTHNLAISWLYPMH